MCFWILFLAVTAESAGYRAETSYCPQWSPDGKQLVFYSKMDGHWRILRINIDGSNLKILSQGSHHDYYPSFSPKGDRIVFYSIRDGNAEIYAMETDGSDVTRLTSDPGSDEDPRWSPDGSQIGYVCDRAICIMNADGSGRIRLTDPNEIPVVSRISWSPDGAKVVFYSTSDKNEMSSANQWSLFSVSVDTKAVEQLNPSWGRDSNPDWSSASGRIVVDGNKTGSWDSGDGGWEIFAMNPDGSSRRNLTRNDGRNDWGGFWSPDGTRIAYCSGINDQYEIHVINADGTNERQVTHLINDALFEDPRDGKRYSVVRLGTQVWMGHNLAFETQNSWCYQDSEDCQDTGRLYAWNAAMESCPEGWHLPTDEEWMTLEAYLGMATEDLRKTGPRGTDEGAKMRTGGSSGLHIPIAGYRRPTGESVRHGERAAFWLATEKDRENAWHRDVRSDVGTIYRSPVTKTYALSVRCIQ